MTANLLDSAPKDCGGKGHSMRGDVVFPVISSVSVIVPIIVLIVLIKRKMAREEVRRQPQHVSQDASHMYSLSPLALNTVDDNQLARVSSVEPPSYEAPLATNINTPPVYDPRKDDYDPRKESGKHSEQPPAYSTNNRLPEYASAANNRTPTYDKATKY